MTISPVLLRKQLGLLQVGNRIETSETKLFRF